MLVTNMMTEETRKGITKIRIAKLEGKPINEKCPGVLKKLYRQSRVK